MQRRGFMVSMVLGGLLAVLTGGALAQPLAPGVALVNPPQPGGVNGQIEVLEFFSYGCPHCNEFEPKLTAWRTAMLKDVVFRRVPVSFGRPEWAALSRLYLTLSAMQLSDKLDAQVFAAIHSRRIELWQEPARNQWLTSQGVDVRRFNDTWKSFGVDAQVRRAEQLAASYKIGGVPQMAVDGRYTIEGGHDEMLRTASGLVEKLRTEKKSAQPETDKAKK